MELTKTLKLTKHAHACIEVEHGGKRIVIDPGAYTPNVAEVLARADAVLVTHAHLDHLALDAVMQAMTARDHMVIFGPEPAVAPLREALAERVKVVEYGDVFDVEGLSVSVHGGLHAEVLPAMPRDANVGYLLGGKVFHPGDSFDVPDARVDTLLVPVSAPWLKMSEVAKFVDAVKPRRAIAIHEIMLSEIGLTFGARLLGNGTSPCVPVEFLEPGTEF